VNDALICRLPQAISYHTALLQKTPWTQPEGAQHEVHLQKAGKSPC
jgi:hypothetical protein